MTITFILRVTRDLIQHKQVYVFSTHFYRTLKDDGVEAVTNWTLNNPKKKDRRINVDIFNKKFIFIPVNKIRSHWSLAVVVNPGCIILTTKSLTMDDRSNKEWPW